MDGEDASVLFRLHDMMKINNANEMNHPNVERPQHELRVSNRPSSRMAKRRGNGNQHNRDVPRRTYSDDDSTDSSVTPTTSSRSLKVGVQMSRALKSSYRRHSEGTSSDNSYEVEDEDMKMLTLNDFSLSLKGILSQCGMVEPPDEPALNLRDEDFHWHSGSQSFDDQSLDNTISNDYKAPLFS